MQLAVNGTFGTKSASGHVPVSVIASSLPVYVPVEVQKPSTDAAGAIASCATRRGAASRCAGLDLLELLKDLRKERHQLLQPLHLRDGGIGLGLRARHRMQTSMRNDAIERERSSCLRLERRRMVDRCLRHFACRHMRATH